MPLYDFKCECGNVFEERAKIEEREKVCQCGKTATRIITSRYSVVGDFQPYLDTHLAAHPVVVKSKKHREKLMKEHGVYEKYGKGWQ